MTFFILAVQTEIALVQLYLSDHLAVPLSSLIYQTILLVNCVTLTLYPKHIQAPVDLGSCRL